MGEALWQSKPRDRSLRMRGAHYKYPWHSTSQQEPRRQLVNRRMLNAPWRLRDIPIVAPPCALMETDSKGALSVQRGGLATAVSISAFQALVTRGGACREWYLLALRALCQPVDNTRSGGDPQDKASVKAILGMTADR